MSQSQASQPETDPRFPSGPWVGFFTQPQLPGKHQMELHLWFAQGVLTGEGRDLVGKFTVRGRYDLADGRCHWAKRYHGKHDVHYKGFNEGKGIWGVWEIPPAQNHGMHWTGGFYIWPKGMADPTTYHLAAEADVPVVVDDKATRKELVPAGG